MSRTTVFFRAILASGLIALHLLSGCGEQPPKAPLGSHIETSKTATTLGKKTSAPTISSSPSSSTLVERENVLNMALMQMEDFAYSQLVPASTGGTLQFGEFTFYVPPGSLNEDTIISITQTSDSYIQMDFGPDGTQFDPPATMTVSYATANLRNLKPSNLSVSWFNTATNQWVNIGGTVDQNAKTVSASVAHFTRYSLSTR